jgi:hypothetical protein
MNINLRPKLDCKTIWNSTYDMLDVALKLKDSLDLYFYQSNCLLPFDSWSKFEQILDYLKAFKEATLLSCADKYPTLSLVVPLYNAMMDHLQLWMTEKTQPGDSIKTTIILLLTVLQFRQCLIQDSILDTTSKIRGSSKKKKCMK